ncbi:hypothetical protein MAR_037043 [Mya arenaria]|uniref:Uncharacterized protein n=1 Tax=Mya arenaria TaxID=6604 RepID=A0ABY7FR85_MYAAR|nr:hypothetical protein MAR_037043 [Mya arenaria]
MMMIFGQKRRFYLLMRNFFEEEELLQFYQNSARQGILIQKQDLWIRLESFVNSYLKIVAQAIGKSRKRKYHCLIRLKKSFTRNMGTLKSPSLFFLRTSCHAMTKAIDAQLSFESMSKQLETISLSPIRLCTSLRISQSQSLTCMVVRIYGL